MINTSKNSYLIYITMVILVVSSIWIILSNNGRIIVSADFDDSLLLWHHWLIVGLPFVILYLLPYKNPEILSLQEEEKQTLKSQTHYLLIAALFYFLALIITPAEHVFDFFYIYKLVFLLFVPLIIFKWKPKIKLHRHSAKKQWKFALIPVVVWMFMYFFSPWSSSESNTYEMNFLILLTGALVSFLLNSVLEELFYRVWLQTRLEIFLGTWPAICVTALLWAVWHVTIQSAGSFDVTLANSMANHGLMGLFLGLLWSKYRNFWVLIIVHGLTNFPLEIISRLLGN